MAKDLQPQYKTNILNHIYVFTCVYVLMARIIISARFVETRRNDEQLLYFSVQIPLRSVNAAAHLRHVAVNSRIY